jgi:hypothetical protein
MLQEKKGNRKKKKDTGKWCDFHKIPWHNTDEYHSKTSLMFKIKEKESSPDSKSNSETNKRKHIIDVEPTSTIATKIIQPKEPKDLEEGEHLFHSQMWVKGTPLHFIVDRGSQKNLISVEVIKKLDLSMLAHGQTQGSSLQQCTNKALTTSPFGNTCEADEISPEVEAGVVARLRCLQP